MKMIRFPIVFGRFRISRNQLTVFGAAIILFICFLLLTITFGDGKPESEAGDLSEEDAAKWKKHMDSADKMSLLRQQRMKMIAEKPPDREEDVIDKPLPDGVLVGVPPGGLVEKGQGQGQGQVDMPVPVMEKPPHADDQQVPKPEVKKKETGGTTTAKENAAGIVARFDDAGSYKHLNYSRFKSLQDQVQRLGALLQEKTDQLKRWSGWGEQSAVEKYFLVKQRIVQPVPFKWQISESDLVKLQKDREYFNQLKEAVNKTRAIALKYKPIYDLTPESCSCSHTQCSCCTRVYVKRLQLDQRVCLNFTYNTQGTVHTKMFFGTQLAFDKQLPTKEAGEICLTDAQHLIEVCSQFLNLTMAVNADADHKTSWNGCLEFHVNALQNVTTTIAKTTTANGLTVDKEAFQEAQNKKSEAIQKVEKSDEKSKKEELKNNEETKIEKVYVTIASYPVGCFQTSQDSKNDLKVGFGFV